MSIKIFLADDHAVVRIGLRYLLEEQPDMLVVGEATSGRFALHELLRLRPDVAVLDIAMPELDGIEVTRQIHEAIPAMQIIILSMYATSEHVYQALKAGARGYVLKEAAGAELIEAVRAVYAGHRHLSTKISDSFIEDYLIRREQSNLNDPLAQLTSQEREILKLVAEGKTSKAIGELLSLSPKTVETYRSRLMQKLDLHDLPSLVKFAIQYGLITLE